VLQQEMSSLLATQEAHITPHNSLLDSQKLSNVSVYSTVVYPVSLSEKLNMKHTPQMMRLMQPQNNYS
jgi:hypothetical protein